MPMAKRIKLEKKNERSIAELTNQIILDILSRVPFKTLFQCKLVCKDWKTIILDPHFRKLHHSRAPAILLVRPLFNSRGSQQLRLIDLQIAALDGRPRDAFMKLKPSGNSRIHSHYIVNSCNGFVCMSDGHNVTIYIGNPILGTYITLPYSRSDWDSEYYDKPDARICAFGFSPATNQYKVIRFFLKENDTGIYRDEAEAEIYTLGEVSWRKIGRVPFHLPNLSYNSLVNGAIHWLNSTGDSPDFIRCFDFGAEQSRVVPGPPDSLIEGDRKLMSVGVLCGSLSVCDFSRLLHIEVWLMKEYGVKESWSKEFVIEENIAIKVKGGCYLQYCEPIMILKSGEMLMLIRTRDKDALVLYIPKLGSAKNLNIYGIKSDFYGCAHIPSFVSPWDLMVPKEKGF